MTTPDFPDWTQPVADVLTETVVFDGVVASGATPALDVSAYETVAVFTPGGGAFLKFTVDQAGTEQVRYVMAPAFWEPYAVVAQWLTVTTMSGPGTSVKVIGYNRAIAESSVYGGENVGWNGQVSGSLVAGTTYQTTLNRGLIPQGLCSAYQSVTGTVVHGLWFAGFPDASMQRLTDTQQTSGTVTALGRTSTQLLVIPPATVGIFFECVVSGSATAQLFLSGA